MQLKLVFLQFHRSILFNIKNNIVSFFLILISAYSVIHYNTVNYNTLWVFSINFPITIIISFYYYYILERFSSIIQKKVQYIKLRHLAIIGSCTDVLFLNNSKYQLFNFLEFKNLKEFVKDDVPKMEIF